MKNYVIKFVLNGEEGQVILFRNDLASQVVSNLAMKGATSIEVVRKSYKQVTPYTETMELVEDFRMFINEV